MFVLSYTGARKTFRWNRSPTPWWSSRPTRSSRSPLPTSAARTGSINDYAAFATAGIIVVICTLLF
jgi:hypothetical protein